MKKPQSLFWTSIAVVGFAAFSAQPARATIVFGQVDDFEDSTLMNWAGSLLPATAPQNIDTGGPAGADDNYLQITASGGFGPGSRLATYNVDQWAGDITSAGVTTIDADVRNFGTTGDLGIRVLLFGDGGEFTSTVPVSVPNDGFWHHIVLGLTPADLTGVGGGSDVAATLANCYRLMIRHHPGDPEGEAPPIVGQMGLDNITATPEPASLTLLALCVPLFFRRRR